MHDVDGADVNLTLSYEGISTDYSIVNYGYGYRISGPANDGTGRAVNDFLTDVERVKFWDQTIELNPYHLAQSTYNAYDPVYDPTLDLGVFYSG